MTEISNSYELNFEKSRQNLAKILSNQISEDQNKVDNLLDAFNKEPGSPGDKKAVLDQVFKDTILQHVLQNHNSKALESLLSLSIEAIHKDICNATLPVLLLNDIFDCLTIEKCEEMFAFVEKHVDTWKQEAFFNSTKNSLLRMCNDLLRRLSRSQNTVFCGRILLFLAKFFPLSERSGLNVASEFNFENMTVADDSAIASTFSTEKDDAMEEGEMGEPQNVLRVDYNLYRKFWALQDFFRNPTQCYNKISWRAFIAHSDEVMKAFSSFKLDDVKPASRHTLQPQDATATIRQPVYFAKYLTNPKLLDLQLSDSNFRRCVLIQFLILFQYLQSVVKFKPETHILTEEQNQAIKVANDKIYKLLEETPPNGAEFAKSIEHILKREEHWNHWKNEGCPDFYKPSTEVAEKPAKPSRPKRKAGDDIRLAVSHNKCLMGNASLTKLWNLCPDNMEACRSQKRDFLPSLETFFEEAIEQADPVNMIEDEYKHVYNSNYGWRALRLLARRSPHFFTPSTQPISKLPLYLETMIKKLAKEIPHVPEEDVKPDLQEKAMAEGGEDSDDELLKNTEETIKEENGIVGREEEMDVNLVTADQINTIVDKLGAKWKSVAPLIGCEEDEIAYHESECSDPVEQGRKMLTVWRDNYAEKATASKLAMALTAVGFEQLAKDVFKDEV